MSDTKLAYSVPEAVEATGIKRRTLLTMCKTGKVRAVKIGKGYIIPVNALLALLGEDELAKAMVANG